MEQHQFTYVPVVLSPSSLTQSVILILILTLTQLFTSLSRLTDGSPTRLAQSRRITRLELVRRAKWPTGTLSGVKLRNTFDASVSIVIIIIIIAFDSDAREVRESEGEDNKHERAQKGNNKY